MLKIHDKHNVKILNKKRIIWGSWLIRRKFKKSLTKCSLSSQAALFPPGIRRRPEGFKRLSVSPRRPSHFPELALYCNLLLRATAPLILHLQMMRDDSQLEEAVVRRTLRVLPSTQSLSGSQKINNHQETKLVIHKWGKNGTQEVNLRNEWIHALLPSS